MDTYTKIKDIFHSGTHAFRVNEESIMEIAFLIDEKYLLLETINISNKNEYYKILESDNLNNKEKFYKASGGAEAHVALKLLLEKYLNKNYEIAVDFEKSFCGYFPDVLSKDKHIVGECGHTQNSEKMLVYFKNGKIKECIQFPYPDSENENMLGHKFTAGDDLHEFLDFLHLEKINKARSFVSKR